MVFADLFFLFAFLPAFAICYLLAGLAKGNGVKNGVLVFFSLVFYAWGEPIYVFLLIACALLNFLYHSPFRKVRLVYHTMERSIGNIV